MTFSPYVLVKDLSQNSHSIMLYCFPGFCLFVDWLEPGFSCFCLVSLNCPNLVQPAAKPGSTCSKLVDFAAIIIICKVIICFYFIYTNRF